MPLSLIDHATFGELRLAQFFPKLRVVPPSKKDPGAGRRLQGKLIVQVVNWQYEERVWVGEVIGFTEFLRPEDDADVTRSIAVELSGKRGKVGESILSTIGLPLECGLDQRGVQPVLGKPKRVYTFVAAQKTLEFRVGSRGRSYTVGCTVHNQRGLTYVTVMK